MLQRCTAEGIGWPPLHSRMGCSFLSRSEQITSRLREPDPQLLEHCGAEDSVSLTPQQPGEANVPKASPGPRLLHATSSVQDRTPFHSAGQRVDADGGRRTTRLFSFLPSQRR